MVTRSLVTSVRNVHSGGGGVWKGVILVCTVLRLYFMSETAFVSFAEGPGLLNSHSKNFQFNLLFFLMPTDPR